MGTYHAVLLIPWGVGKGAGGGRCSAVLLVCAGPISCQEKRGGARSCGCGLLREGLPMPCEARLAEPVQYVGPCGLFPALQV